MINKQQTLKLSPYSGIYDEVLTERNLYKMLHDEVDFTFIRKELEDKYSSDLGRSAVDPVVLLKALIIKEITELSDRDLVEEICVNMAYRYFLDMTPTEKPFEASLLSFFRRKRLKDCDLMNLLISEMLELACRKGVLSRNKSGKISMTVAIDSTHIESKGVILQPMEGIRHFSRKLIRSLEFGYDESLSHLPEWKIPNFKSTEEALKFAQYLLDLALREFPDCRINGRSRLCYNRLEEAVEDILAHASCSPSDRDAQVGHKSASTKFGGYKGHMAADVDSGMAAAATVTGGSVSDTPVGEEMVDKLMDSEQVDLEGMLGDGSYGSTRIIEKSEGNFDLVATPNHMLGSSESNYQKKGFTYNKDADRLVCRAGHMAIKDNIKRYKNENDRVARLFYFDIEKCKCCKFKEGCYKDGAKSKSCAVTLCSDLQKAYLEKTKTPEFKEKFKKRTIIERAFSQMKQKIGLRKAKYYGIEMMTIQTAIAIGVYNLKIIMRKSHPEIRK